MLIWIKNYPAMRKQCTFANEVVSSYLDLSCGLPRGSILGPLFFTVYVNDIKTCLQHCKYLLYADDTVLYSIGELHRSTVETQADLSMFKSWSDRNQLTMNIKKTRYVWS